MQRWHIAAGVLVVLALAAIIASFVSVPYYAITPGSAQSVGPFIVVPKSETHSHKGTVMLVDVELTPLRAIQWLYYKLDPAATIVPAGSLLGPETAEQYNTEGVLDMQNAQQAATVVALRQLGYHVGVTSDGALLYALLPGSPAEASLAVGDVVTSVDGKAVRSATDLGVALEGQKPGARVHMALLTYPHDKAETATVRLGQWHLKGKGSSATLDCIPLGRRTSEPVAKLVEVDGQIALPSKGRTGHPVACLGVLDVETSYRTGPLPIKINLASEGIVGPSAGLAFTLGLIEKLDTGDLTGGHLVAATGTMSISGQVGAIGGIQQKTIAVRNARGSIFLVPQANYKVAKQYAGSSLKVYAVNTIGQAISVLERYGGRLASPAAGSQ